MFRFFRGYVLLQIHGGSAERFFNLCRNHGIFLKNIRKTEDTFQCYMDLHDFSLCSMMADKSGVTLCVIREYGLPFYWKRYHGRYALLSGIWILLFLVLFASGHLWEIKIEKNSFYTDDQIFSFLKENGIETGIRKNRVNCDMLEQKLRDHFERISWTSAWIDGTVLRITVAENYSDLEAVIAETDPADLIAESDGIVERIIVRQGKALVKTGDTVKKGQVLISGAVPLHNDSEELTGYRLVHASGDVQLLTEVSYRREIPAEERKWTDQGYSGAEVRLFMRNHILSLCSPYRIFHSVKKQMTEQVQSFLSDNRLSDRRSEVGKESAVNDYAGEKERIEIAAGSTGLLRIPELNLEIGCYKITYRDGSNGYYLLSEKKAEEILQEELQDFVQNQEKKEKLMVENQVRIYYDSVVYRAEGILRFSERQNRCRGIESDAYPKPEDAQEESL